ncbi:TetR/AcrR family transcriptional regulator [Streptomyces sp. NPDC098781]|uniref:TetR/AcrR family transcriptional regulator n=1 Tax=Streptomyces sp. NPDC098781 TaxID=3366097 RepID=UPI00382577C7
MPKDPLEKVKHLHADAATTRPGGRTARTGEAVMEATLAELSEVGYAALRIDSVAERAGVNKTTIYRRWGDKAGLVATAFIERQSTAAPPRDTGNLRGDLMALLREMRRVLRTPWITALLSELGPRSAESGGVREVLDKIWPERFRESRTIFVRAMERGELPADASPDFLLEAASGPLYFRWLMLGRPLSDAYLEKTADFVINGARAGLTDTDTGSGS